MAANHKRNVLDAVDALAQKVRDLQGALAVLPAQRLDHKTLSGTGTITLTVPPGSSYNTLRVVWAGAANGAGTATYMCVRLNADASSTHYLWQFNQANVTTQSSAGSAGTVAQIQIGTMPAVSATAGYLGAGEFTIPSANGSTFKALTGSSNSQNAAANGFSGSYGGLWLSTAAVSSLQLFPLGGSLIAGSTASLYGWS